MSLIKSSKLISSNHYKNCIVKGQFQIPELKLRLKAKEDGITKLVVGVAVVNDKRILIVRRISNNYMGGMFELPGGGVEDDESIEETIKRETLEETGLKIVANLNQTYFQIILKTLNLSIRLFSA